MYTLPRNARCTTGREVNDDYWAAITWPAASPRSSSAAGSMRPWGLRPLNRPVPASAGLVAVRRAPLGTPDGGCRGGRRGGFAASPRRALVRLLTGGPVVRMLWAGAHPACGRNRRLADTPELFSFSDPETEYPRPATAWQSGRTSSWPADYRWARTCASGSCPGSPCGRRVLEPEGPSR
jgi:hypothetical protein